METKEPDSRLSVRRKDLDDQELYRLNQIINDLYSKVSTARDETADAARSFIRSGVVSSVSDSSTPSVIPVIPDGDLPQIPASDWVINPIVYSAGEDGQQYGFVSITVANKPPVIDYFSLFVQDYSSGYVNTVGTAVTLTSSSKEAGSTFEKCVAGQIININSVAYTIAVTPTSPYESLTLASSAGTQNNVYFNLDPVDGAWVEIAPDAEVGSWQLRPPQGLDIPCCVTASTKLQKTYEPPNGTNYKRLVFAAWGVAPQLSSFTVTVEQQTQAGVLSGIFVVNFTRPLDPEYYYSSIERLWYVNNTFAGDIGATAIVDVVGTTVTYNTSSGLYSSTFRGQNFNYLQAGDTVYINAGLTLPESNAYIIAEVINNTELRLTTAPPAGVGQVFAQWTRIAAEANSFRQSDYWPLPSNVEYWKFRARSVNHREIANNTAPPTANVTVPLSTGVDQIAPGAITAAAFASTIRPVDLVTTAGISVTSIVVATNVGTVTTSSAHGLSTGRQVAIYGGTGTSSKVNGLYAITVTGGSTFTVTTAGVLNGTYSAGFFEVPFPVLPSALYPNGAVAFMTANTKLYRSNNSTWTSAADGSDLVANSITAGQIAAGAISTTELFAGEILVGAGSGRPTRFQVVDSANNMIGFIGDITTPILFTGGYFKKLLLANTLNLAAEPRIYVDTSTIPATMEMVGVTITSTNIGTAGFDPGTVSISPGNPYGAVQVSSAALSSLSAMGPNYFTLRSNNPGNWYPFCELYRTSTRAIVRGFGDPSFNSFFEFSIDAVAASSYANFKGVPIKINNVDAIDASRNGYFVNLTLTGSLTAGGGPGTSGQVLVSTGAGVQWSTGASGTLTSINSMTGPAITIAAGSGISISNASNTVTISSSGGVTSITGTANQVIASAATGAVTLSLPQDIDSTDSPTFASIIVGGSGSYVPGAIYSDANWGMIFRAKQASPASAEFRWTTSADVQLMSLSSAAQLSVASVVSTIGFNTTSTAYNSIQTLNGFLGTQLTFTSKVNPGASGAGTAVIYMDSGSNELRASVNGGGYVDLLASSGVSSVNSMTGAISIAASTGISIGSASGTVTITNTGVTSITGTANQVIVTGSTAVTLNLPQDIHSAATPIFGGMTINGALSVTTTVKLLTSSVAGYVWKATDTVGNGGWSAVPTSITGTTNQVIASGSTGAITLNLPQSIATTSDVQFNKITLPPGLSIGIIFSGYGTVLSHVGTNLYLDNLGGGNDIYIRTGSGRYTFVAGGFFSPEANNTTSLGHSGHGWSNVYSYAYYANNGSWVSGTSATISDAVTNITVVDGIVTSVSGVSGVTASVTGVTDITVVDGIVTAVS